MELCLDTRNALTIRFETGTSPGSEAQILNITTSYRPSPNMGKLPDPLTKKVVLRIQVG
jgi:hypothetical protein